MCISPQHGQCSSGQVMQWTNKVTNSEFELSRLRSTLAKGTAHFTKLSPHFHQTFTTLSPNFHHTIPTLSPNFRHTFTKSPPHFTKLSPHQHNTWHCHDGRDKLVAMSGKCRLYLINDPWHNLLVRNKKNIWLIQVSCEKHMGRPGVGRSSSR